MHLYNLTLQPPTAVGEAIVGNFSGTRQQELVVSHGTGIELLRHDSQTGKVASILSTDVFGSIRSLASFRLTGDSKDSIIVGSDSGRITILDYDAKTTSFTMLHQETFGKSGARRIVPGQYLATDPKGRCVMISAVEKSKLVYILNRDAAANLTISSPVEAHKNATIIHHIVGLDVGFENPIFAALEVDYLESDQDPTGAAFERIEKMLTYYELDLGLKHVVRKWSEPTDPRANLLVQVPGAQSISQGHGPSGVLVCCEDHIIYMHMNTSPHRVPIPRRRHALDDPNRGIIITAAVMHKLKASFFCLLQSEEGDLFKVTIEHEEEQVAALKIKYFDTVPVATSLCVLESGFLFVASEFGNHHLYQFHKLGDDDDEPEYSSSSYPQFGMADATRPLPRAYFRPRPLDNLALTDEIQSLDPILDSKVLNILPNSETPQFFLVCGRGPRSALRMLRHGLDVEEFISSDLPGALFPNAVWSIKKTEEDPHDTLIVLSFINGTIVLSIGEIIEEVRDTGFLTSTPTLAVQQIGTDALLQVHPRGIRHIQAGGRTTEWAAPGGKTIITATTNKRQAVVALSSAELVYFELDLDGQLNEYQEQRAMGSTVLALGIGEVPEGRLRTPYLAVGCEDQTVRIISLDPESTMETVSLQALTAPPSSICIVDMLDSSINKAQPTTFVNIGLRNGVLLRTVLDPTNGQLADARTRFLGTKPVKLFRVQVSESPAVLALSSRTWLNYTHQNLVHFTPLLYENLDFAWVFSGEMCSEGFIGISGSILRIFSVPTPGVKFKQDSIPLSYTPRKMIIHPSNNHFYVVEADHRVLSDEVARQSLEELRQKGERLDEEVVNLSPDIFGRPRVKEGQWGSCIRVVDPIAQKTVATYSLDADEAAFSLAIVSFTAHPDELLLVVGTAIGAVVSPRSCSSGFLRTYKFTDGVGLDLLHKTEVDDVPLSLISFQGRLAAGIGKALRIYDIGKQKLLRKAENKAFTTAIVSLASQGSRIIIGDMQESVQYAVYKESENRLLTFADDSQPRWVSAMTMVDYNTVAAGDRFGNVFVNRLDSEVSDRVDDDPTGDGILHEKGTLMGAPHKTKMLAHFHVGDLITSIHKASLVVGGREVLLYTGLHGTIGILVPLASKEDVDFISTLEQHMRGQHGSLVGRDHLSWRGYHVPVKGVVDGDLCETFCKLPASKQQAIASELDRSVGEVLKKLEQLRVAASGF